MDLGAMAIKGYFVFPKAPALLKPQSDCLMSYTGHSLGESYPSAEIQSVYSTVLIEWATGHSLVESYSSAEMQSVYSTVPVDWATGNSLVESYLSAKMQSQYFTVPVDWANECWYDKERNKKQSKTKLKSIYLSIYLVSSILIFSFFPFFHFI